jgi:hypothetical protein
VKKLVGAILLLLAMVVVAIVGQEFRYLRIRRDRAMDRQELFHPSTVFHVVTVVKLRPNLELRPGVRDFVESVQRSGAEVVYAGMVVINARPSRQIPVDDWDAVVVTQYASREAWDAVGASPDHQALKSRFINT